MLERVTAYASRTLDSSNHLDDPSHNQHYYGDPQEWYTLSENLYRAYQATGNTQFRDFARVWLYHDYWNQVTPTAISIRSASAAAGYAVESDEKYLRINPQRYLQSTQCYATGGYGPNERFMAPDGSRLPKARCLASSCIRSISIGPDFPYSTYFDRDTMP
jgi:hypothetical protein